MFLVKHGIYILASLHAIVSLDTIVDAGLLAILNKLFWRFSQMNPGHVVEVTKHVMPKRRIIERSGLNVNIAPNPGYTFHLRQDGKWVFNVLKRGDRIT